MDCDTWYANAAPGDEGDTSGATQACYDYHLEVASWMDEQGDIDAHCAHAAGVADINGAAPCTDPEPVPCVPYDEAAQVLQNNGCLGCHGGSGGLNLGSYQSITTDPGGSGLAVIPGDAAASHLVIKLRAATNTFGSVMPINNPGSVSDEDLDIIYDWIATGAQEFCP